MTIKNSAHRNESLDPQIIIERLRAEIVRLRKELAIARGEAEEEPIGPEESERLVAQLKEFASGRAEMPPLSHSRVVFCMDWLRASGGGTGKAAAAAAVETATSSDPELRKALNKLAKKLQTREVEIGVLVNMLNQRKNRAVAWTQTSSATGGETRPVERPKVDKKDAFKEYVRNHPSYRAIEANNATMRKKIGTAKELAVTAQALKGRIGALKQELRDRAEADDGDEELEELGTEVMRETERYMKMCDEMRSLRKEVETIQAMIENATKQVKRDFANFWTTQEEQQAAAPSHASAPAPQQQQQQQVVRTPLSGRGSKRDSPASAELGLTGDPQADEWIRKYSESKAAFLKKAEEVRRSQTPEE
jgi:kinesin family protein 6/9